MAVGCEIDVFHGTERRCVFAAFVPPKFTGLNGKVAWVDDKEALRSLPYKQEQLEFLWSICEGSFLHHGSLIVDSTLGSILGHVAVYPGAANHLEGATEMRVRLLARGRGTNGHGTARGARSREPLSSRHPRHHETDLRVFCAPPLREPQLIRHTDSNQHPVGQPPVLHWPAAGEGKR